MTASALASDIFALSSDRALSEALSSACGSSFGPASVFDFAGGSSPGSPPFAVEPVPSSGTLPSVVPATAASAGVLLGMVASVDFSSSAAALPATFGASTLLGLTFARGLAVLFAALADRGLADPRGLAVLAVLGLATRRLVGVLGVPGLATSALLADRGRDPCFVTTPAGERAADGLAIAAAGEEGFPAAPEVSLLRRVETLATAALAGRGEAGVLPPWPEAFFRAGEGVLPGPGDPVLRGAGLVSLGVTALARLGDGLSDGVAGLLGLGEAVLTELGDAVLTGRGDGDLARPAEEGLGGPGEVRGEGAVLVSGEAGLPAGREDGWGVLGEAPGVALAPFSGVAAVLPSCEPVEWRRLGPRTGARGVVLGLCKRGVNCKGPTRGDADNLRFPTETRI